MDVQLESGLRWIFTFVFTTYEIRVGWRKQRRPYREYS